MGEQDTNTRSLVTREETIEVLEWVREQVGPIKDGTFLHLMSLLMNQLGHTCYSILNLIVSLLPIIYTLAYVLRFILDSVIDIIKSQGVRQISAKSGILFGELIIIALCVYLMFVAIFLPVWRLAMSILRTILFVGG